MPRTVSRTIHSWVVTAVALLMLGSGAGLIMYVPTGGDDMHRVAGTLLAPFGFLLLIVGLVARYPRARD